MNYQRLVRAAQQAKKHSYSPYSRFRVGAAVLTRSGKVYSGCNIESASFSLTICAERTALFKAVSESARSFRALAIATDSREFVPPCGACRQVIHDLAGNIDVVLVNSSGRSKEYKARSLLPHPFLDSLLPILHDSGTDHAS